LQVFDKLLSFGEFSAAFDNGTLFQETERPPQWAEREAAGWPSKVQPEY
jgi:hypothetical protein